MPRTVTSTEAQNNFGALIQWAEENDEDVVIERRGVPAAAILSYDQYMELGRLRLKEQRLQALQALRSLREEAQKYVPDFTPEEGYREAGMSEGVIQELIESDRELCNDSE